MFKWSMCLIAGVLVHGAATAQTAFSAEQLVAKNLEARGGEVEASYAAMVAKEVSKLSAALETQGMKRIDLAAWSVDADGARGGRIEALASGLVGIRYTGDVDALTETGEKD